MRRAPQAQARAQARSNISFNDSIVKLRRLLQIVIP